VEPDAARELLRVEALLGAAELVDEPCPALVREGVVDGGRGLAHSSE